MIKFMWLLVYRYIYAVENTYPLVCPTACFVRARLCVCVCVWRAPVCMPDYMCVRVSLTSAWVAACVPLTSAWAVACVSLTSVWGAACAWGARSRGQSPAACASGARWAASPGPPPARARAAARGPARARCWTPAMNTGTLEWKKFIHGLTKKQRKKTQDVTIGAAMKWFRLGILPACKAGAALISQ